MLEDGRTLADYGIQNGAGVNFCYLGIFPMQIYVMDHHCIINRIINIKL